MIMQSVPNSWRLGALYLAQGKLLLVSIDKKAITTPTHSIKRSYWKQSIATWVNVPTIQKVSFNHNLVDLT